MDINELAIKGILGAGPECPNAKVWHFYIINTYVEDVRHTEVQKERRVCQDFKLNALRLS